MPKPVLQALVLADHVYQDRATGKFVIAGTFNRVFVFKRETRPNEPPRPSPESESFLPPGAAAGAEPSLPPESSAMPQPPLSHEPPQNAGQPFNNLRKLTPREICTVGSPWAYISLTEIHGTIPLELRYVDLADNSVMLRVELPVKSNSPLDTVEVVVQLPVLPMPHPGTYALELLSNNEPLGAHRIAADERPIPNQDTEEAGGSGS